MCSIFCTTYNLFPSVLYNIPFSSPTSSATSVHASCLFQFFSESSVTFIVRNQILRNALCTFFIRSHCGRSHFGLNSNRKGMERVFFILRLRLRLHLRCPGSHVWNTKASAYASARKWKPFHLLRWPLHWHLHLRCPGSHLWNTDEYLSSCKRKEMKTFPFLALAFAFALAFALG